MNWLNELTILIKNNLDQLWNLDWSAVQFKQEYFAIRAAAILMAALLFKISWRHWYKREKSVYVHPGHSVERGDRPGLFFLLLGSLSALSVIIGAVWLLAAIADPYLIQNYETKSEESRRMVYLRDTSISMGFKSGNKARGEILQEFLLNLIADRRGHNDRAAYVTFAGLPRRYSGFTTDTDGLLYSVAIGPIVTADPETPKRPELQGIFMLKEFEKIPFEGGTDLYAGLESTIKLFEADDKRNAKKTKLNPSFHKDSIIILTDGASENDPEPAFKEIKKRGIVPYLIFIDPDLEAEKKVHGENSPQTKLPQQLFRQVRRYGGDYFLAKDQASRERIRRRLDQLHTSITQVKSYSAEVHIFRPFLIIGIMFLALGVALRAVLSRFHRSV